MAFLTKKMLIEVKKDIIERAICDANSPANDAALFLSELSLAVKRGKHIVYVPSLSQDTDLSKDLENVIGRNALLLLKSSQKDRSKFYSIYQALSTKAVCSYGEVESDDRWKRIIHINPSQMVSFEVGTETYVIGENLSDISFFGLMSKYYASSKRLKDYTSCYYALMGGGDTTSCVYENECKNKHHFCLVITDSDFKLPCETGKELINLDENSTAGKVLNIHQKYNPKICEFYSMRFVSEVENLIPTELLKDNMVCKNKQEIVLSHDFSFFDIKKGLLFNRLRDKKQFEYWSSIYSTSVDFSDFCYLSTSHPDDKDFKNAANGKTILQGWGNDILKKILESKYLREHYEQLCLMESQRKEWNNIGELMFNWTCSLKPRYA